MSLRLIAQRNLIASVARYGYGRGHRTTFTSAQTRGRCKINDKKGYLQSPVALNSHEVEEIHVPPLIFFNHFGLECVNLLLTQRGDTVMIVPRMEQQPMVVGGPMTSLHVLDHVIFRWGSDDDNGSGHSIDGEKFGMEAEFIYYNCFFDSLSDAMGKKDGVTVMSVLMEVSNNCRNYEVDELVKCVCMIECPGATVPTSTNLLDIFKRPLDSQDYFLYEGSLTFMPYSEEVRWLVFRNTVQIAPIQIQAFRNTCDQEGNRICSNTRDLQSLNGRNVYVPVICALPDSIAQMSVDADEDDPQPIKKKSTKKKTVKKTYLKKTVKKNCLKKK